MKIKIMSDSTCDLSQELLEKYDITLTPLTVIKGGQPYQDGITITPAEIFAHVAAGGDLCSTSAVSIGEYVEVFEKVQIFHLDRCILLRLYRCLCSIAAIGYQAHCG